MRSERIVPAKLESTLKIERIEVTIMILLYPGDIEPKVCAMQILLNRRGESLKVDGYFGPKTRQAVTDFQNKHNLGADGKIGVETWKKLAEGSNLATIDALDFSDTVIPNKRGEIPNTSYATEAALRKAGSSPIVTGAMSGGLRDVMEQIHQRAQGSIVLLRFFGHGSPGSMELSGSSALHVGNVWGQAPVLMKLRPYFARFGSVELHGCQIAGRDARNKIDGKLVLEQLAFMWGVPVTAGINLQYDYDLKRALRFEGPTRTAYPQGGTLQSWSSQFAGVSV